MTARTGKRTGAVHTASDQRMCSGDVRPDCHLQLSRQHSMPASASEHTLFGAFCSFLQALLQPQQTGGGQITRDAAVPLSTLFLLLLDHTHQVTPQSAAGQALEPGSSPGWAAAFRRTSSIFPLHSTTPQTRISPSFISPSIWAIRQSAAVVCRFARPSLGDRFDP